MGRPKKKTYDASIEFVALTETLIHNYPGNKDYCGRYEDKHQILLQKLELEEAYNSKSYGFDEPFILFCGAESREKDALEDYLNAKKQVYLLEHNICAMEDEQMRAVATELFLKQAQQKSAEIAVEGHVISARTVCREKKRAVRYLARCVEEYALWESRALFF